VHGGQPGGFTEEPHAHDFDARIMVLGGETTVIRDDKAETFRAGDCCELPAGCQTRRRWGQRVSPTWSAKRVGRRRLTDAEAPACRR
jgi:uncharacterized cupin superfamily protein